jgi:tetratricopeptide (TPR) repeat protein
MATKLPKKKASKKPAVAAGHPMRNLHKLLDKQQFGSMEEVEAFMQQISKAPIPEFEPENEHEQAEELAYDALEQEGEERKLLLLEALTLDPDCILAYVALGADEFHPAIGLAFYERGIHIGAERFQSEEYLKQNKGHFWGLHETRPFMQCLHGAADCHFALGRVFDAIGIWSLMLELNPNDNQGVRYDLMLCLAGFGDTEGYKELEKQYKDDVSAAAAFNRVLYLFKSQGPGPQALQALQAARAGNKHVVPLLLKQDPKLYAVDGYTLGSKEEAMSYLDKAHLVWSGVPGAKEWLKRVAGK